MPCPYVHIKIGNVYKSSLKEISNYGFSFKYFRDHSSKCLAGEDPDFYTRYLNLPGQTIFNPANPEEIFENKINNQNKIIYMQKIQ